MENNKRVVQISVDVLVENDWDTDMVAEDIVNSLEERNFVVMGACFSDDVSDYYNLKDFV